MKEGRPMQNRLWYPYAPDQQFGVQAAADEDALDRMVAALDAHRSAPPRAGNKAPLCPPRRVQAQTGRVPAEAWQYLTGFGRDPFPAPATLASALDAAPGSAVNA
jgi:hypothetical protein